PCSRSSEHSTATAIGQPHTYRSSGPRPGPSTPPPHAGLYYGAPAIAFMLRAANADGLQRYAGTRRTLDQYICQLTRQPLDPAAERIRQGRFATFAEYDLFYGLIGIGALLLNQLPDSDELGNLLGYLVRLTQPHSHDGLRVPGWWVEHDPDPI